MDWILCVFVFMTVLEDSFPKPNTGNVDRTKDTAWIDPFRQTQKRVPRDLSRNAISDKSMRWANGRIPYVIHSDYNANEKQVILLSMREIESDVNTAGSECIKFVPKEVSDFSYVEIFKGTDCSSDVGFQNIGRQESSIASACVEKGPVMHELLHVLGFYHEQTRYDRDQFVDINWANTDSPENFEKATLGAQNTYSTPYDFKSIMHYGPYFMATDRSVPVLTPKADKAAGVMIGQRLSLSNFDVTRIQRLYQCQEDTTHVIHVESESSTFCTFENDICDLVQDTPGAWVLKNSISSKGPNAGHTNGIDKYLVAEETINSGKTVKMTTAQSELGSSCVDFFLFQKGPGSFLRIEVGGPLLSAPVPLISFTDEHHNRWQHKRIPFRAPAGVQLFVC